MVKKVALVLSSGGARGIAHIGAIEELENQGFSITSVSGSSIGALIGGIYAMGKLNRVGSEGLFPSLSSHTTVRAVRHTAVHRV